MTLILFFCTAPILSNSNYTSTAPQVPSYKFIPLTYQISSRVGSADDPRFRACVHRLILRLCLEHPHHSLLQLLALANGENVSGGGATQVKIMFFRFFVFFVYVL